MCSGGVQVSVLEARDIPRADTMGTTDASIEIFTDVKRKLSTKVVKNSLTPKWEGEDHFLMVQVRVRWSLKYCHVHDKPRHCSSMVMACDGAQKGHPCDMER
jgi:Ca2+-dependent lipid-binding protein